MNKTNLTEKLVPEKREVTYGTKENVLNYLINILRIIKQ